jgi:uncharacterized protein (TIGR03435 family)
MSHSPAPKANLPYAPLLAFLAMAAFIPATGAQQPAPAAAATPLPTYDVVSVHPNNSLNVGMHWSTNPGIVTFTNVTLKWMLSYAYGIREGLIDGLPSWAESAHFDVEAKVVDPDIKALKAMTREQRTAMFIPVLAERFGARVHTETKTLPVYELVLLKGGPRFKEYVAAAANTPAKGNNLGPGTVNIQSVDMALDVTATGMPISWLAEDIARRVDKTVVDKTGLTGKYDFELKFTPDNARMNAGPVEPTDQAPNIYTALQEQLGLKLVSSKGPVVTLIVDQLKQPTEN